MKIDLIGALASAGDVSKRAGTAPATRGVNPASAGFVPSSGLRDQPFMGTDWSMERADLEGFKSCSWVYACVDRLTGMVSSVPWRSMERVGKRSGQGRGEWEGQPDSPYELAIEYPNDEFSRQRLIAATTQHLCIGGNALWKVVRVTRTAGRIPSEFWPLYPERYRPIPVTDDSPTAGGVSSWIRGYKRLDKPYDPIIAPADIIHPQFPDPANLLWGLSPMRAIARVIDMDVKHVRWNAALPDNRMTPETAIVDRNIKSDKQLNEAAARLHERYIGPDRAGRPLMLGAGAEVLRLGLTPQEMGWIESRRFTMIEICAAYGLIPSLLIPDAKYANQDVAVKHAWRTGCHRILTVLEDALNTRLVPRDLRSKIWIHFDLSGIPELSDTLEKRLEAHERAVRSGIPPNRSFLMLDIPVDPIEGGDEPLVSGALQPLRQVLQDPEQESAEPGEGGGGGFGDEDEENEESEEGEG